ncbi:hypothetical protein AX15_006436 [Amanita polypyramis BW_CC]|nr:hypothetical protein AX15_006436 [Amanita polypyramis BW_CC]
MPSKCAALDRLYVPFALNFTPHQCTTMLAANATMPTSAHGTVYIYAVPTVMDPMYTTCPWFVARANPNELKQLHEAKRNAVVAQCSAHNASTMTTQQSLLQCIGP